MSASDESRLGWERYEPEHDDVVTFPGEEEERLYVYHISHEPFDLQNPVKKKWYVTSIEDVDSSPYRGNPLELVKPGGTLNVSQRTRSFEVVRGEDDIFLIKPETIDGSNGDMIRARPVSTDSQGNERDERSPGLTHDWRGASGQPGTTPNGTKPGSRKPPKSEPRV